MNVAILRMQSRIIALELEVQRLKELATVLEFQNEALREDAMNNRTIWIEPNLHGEDTLCLRG